MNRKGGLRRKSRSKMTRAPGLKGKIKIRNHFQTFNKGDKIQLIADSSNPKSLFHLRFHGKNGVVREKRGNAYVIDFMDFAKAKQIVVNPVHLKRL